LVLERDIARVPDTNNRAANSFLIGSSSGAAATAGHSATLQIPGREREREREREGERERGRTSKFSRVRRERGVADVRSARRRRRRQGEKVGYEEGRLCAGDRAGPKRKALRRKGSAHAR
jgi:hypothetical protein